MTEQENEMESQEDEIINQFPSILLQQFSNEILDFKFIDDETIEFSIKPNIDLDEFMQARRGDIMELVDFEKSITLLFTQDDKHRDMTT